MVEEEKGVSFPEVNVIAAGDILFNGVYPFIDLDQGGTVSGFLAAQEKILAMADEDTKIISGHGPLGDKADLQAAHDMVADTLARVKVLVDEGKSETEVLADNPLASYDEGWSWYFISTEIFTKTLYRSLTEGK